MRRAFVVFAFGLALTATTGATHAQTAPDATTGMDAALACDSNSADALGRRACYSSALAAAEQALTADLNALRGAARALEAADRRRSALAAIDAADNAWRRLREHDCGLKAAMSDEENDPTVAQMTCAIAFTHERRRAIAVLGGDAMRAGGADTPAVAAVASAASAASQPEPELISSQDFRDWRAGCRANAACMAMISVGDAASDGPTYALRVERAAPDQDWSVRLAPAAAPAAEAAVTVAIDGLEPIAFLPEQGFHAAAEGGELVFVAPLKTARMFEGMLAGLELTAQFTDADGAEHAERFSLRGLSAALAWIENEQATARE